MAVERTYLGYLRFGVYIISFSFFCQRMWMLSRDTAIPETWTGFRLATAAAALGGILAIAISIFSFYLDVLYINGGTAVAKDETTDPRVYMAAERTFLAWVRTAISLIIFGFVVENFELLLTQIGRAQDLKAVFKYAGLVEVGIFIIVIGVATVVIGLINFHATVRQIDSGAYRTNINVYRVYGSILFVTCMALIIFLFNLI